MPFVVLFPPLHAFDFFPFFCSAHYHDRRGKKQIMRGKMVQTSSVEYFFHIFFFCRVRLSCLRLLVRPGFSALIHAQLCVSVCVCVSCVPVAYCVMRRMRFQSCRDFDVDFASFFFVFAIHNNPFTH